MFDVEGSVENSSELEKPAEVEKSENSNDSEIQEKQTESESNMRREGSGDKETTSEETSASESNQGLSNKENSKKDDTLTTETMSDTEGGFIVEVDVPKQIDCIELEWRLQYFVVLSFKTHSLTIFLLLVLSIN